VTPVERLLNIVHWWTSAFWVLRVAVGLLRRRCIPGTRARYVFATAERALFPLAWADVVVLWVRIPLPDVEPLIRGAMLLAAVVITRWTWLDWKRMENDDDDNWWRDTGKRIKGWLRSQRHALRPAWSPMGPGRWVPTGPSRGCRWRTTTSRSVG
jgi:hypothetical protein